MSQQFTPTLLNIMQAFQKQGLTSNSYYSRDQIYQSLDRMCGQEYDRQVAEQLFEQCQVNYKQQVVIEADRILKRKVSQTEEQLQQYKQEKDECLKQHNDSKCMRYLYNYFSLDNQQVNSLGVEKDSLLSVLLHSASNIRTNQVFSMSFVTLTVGKYQHTSNGSSGDKVNPTYNQQFQFIIETGQEDVDIKLYIVNRQNEQVLVGQGQVELGELHDQAVHEQVLQLKDLHGSLTGTTLSIEVQWMYNKAKYYNELMEKYNESLDQLGLDLEDFRRDLSIIQAPFTSIRDSRPLQQSQQYSHPITIQPQVQPIQYAIPSTQQLPGVPSEELHVGFILMLVMGFFSLLESFARPEFVDLILFLLMLIIVVLDHFNPDHIKVVAIINVCSIVMDIIWLAYYKVVLIFIMFQMENYYFSSDKTDPLWSSSGQGVVRMVLIFTFLNVILKVLLASSIISIKSILCYFLFHFYQHSQKSDVLHFQFWKFEFVVGQDKNNIFSAITNKTISNLFASEQRNHQPYQ